MNSQRSINTFLGVGFLFLIILISGCGESEPSIDKAKNILLTKVIKTDAGGLYHLLNFEKTNGMRSNQAGFDVYTLFYKATIEFDKNCYYEIIKDEVTGELKQIFISAKTPSSDMPLFSLYKREIGKPRQRFIFENKINFVKTEKGWDLFNL
jgi:hypothetical protein